MPNNTMTTAAVAPRVTRDGGLGAHGATGAEDVPPIVAGVVLAGGRSSRMGRDKVRMRPLGDGTPDLLTHAVRVLEEVVPVVWVGCRQGQRQEGFHCIHDVYDGFGPISGVHAALYHAAARGCAAVLVLPCDVPLMDAATVRRLLSARAERLARQHADTDAPLLMTTYRQAETGYIEALVSVYEIACLPLFDAAYHAGARQINLIIPGTQRCEIVYTRAEARPFYNLNFPEDVAGLPAVLACGGEAGNASGQEDNRP